MGVWMNVTKNKLLFQAHGKMIAGSEVTVGECTVKIVNNCMYLAMYYSI
jgi:hypothetical protein